MRQKIIFVGLDVDDKAFHAGLLYGDTGEFEEFVCRPTVAALHTKLKTFHRDGYAFKICYEASYIGFSLQRAIADKGWECEVISPNHIPREYGAKVKTDRLDALKLATYYAKGLLTPIFIPSQEQESERDLIRSRRFLKSQESNVKRFILSLCRRVSLDYRKETNNTTAHYWSAKHRQWLQGAIGKTSQSSWQLTLRTLMITLGHLEEQIKFMDQEIEKISRSPRYEDGIQALNCYRGFDVLSSMTLMTELGSVKRFTHPRQITSYAGMDIKEYSSGGKERKAGITKMGNSHLRRALIESCQFAWSTPKISPNLKKRRLKVKNPEWIAIADRCMRRLYSRSHHLMQKGKHKNKVKVACARESLGFVWETLRSVGY